MAIRDKISREAVRFMEPGEEIQAVFLAKRPSMEYLDSLVRNSMCLRGPPSSVSFSATTVASETGASTPTAALWGEGSEASAYFTERMLLDRPLPPAFMACCIAQISRADKGGEKVRSASSGTDSLT
jgi:hypothetical protein